MPVVAPTTNKAKGTRTVRYRSTQGRMFNATVMGPGSTSGLKLRIWAFSPAGVAQEIRDNIPMATGPKQTNVYYNRAL